jgi:nucleotide-binding universal stress UspA family protein
MMIKDIIALIDADSRPCADFAASLASAYEAHLTLAAAVVDRTYSAGFSEAAVVYASSTLDKERAAASHLLDELATEIRQRDLKVEEEAVEGGFGAIPERLGALLRLYDLTVLPQPDPDVRSDRWLFLETALFGSGRPLLIVPYIQQTPFRVDRVLVAWDGGVQAARALADSLPLLYRAARIDLVTVGASVSDLAAAARHLERHGLAATHQNLSGGTDVANMLLSYASDSRSDLLVMGGYGHRRVRELVFGGATRDILRSMTLPVFMSH